MTEFLERIAQLSPKKLALLAAELRSRLDRIEQARTEPIAVVGLGCRLPGGAVDPKSYWRLLRGTARSSTVSICSTRISSASRRVKRWRSIRSSVCCSK
jgi:hypothetical protein